MAYLDTIQRILDDGDKAGVLEAHLMDELEYFASSTSRLVRHRIITPLEQRLLDRANVWLESRDA